jgi:hypothetical protein
MGTSSMSPDDIRAAAGAHHELGAEYSDAVVASFLEKVDQEIAARVAERLAASTPRARPVEPASRRMLLLKGFAMGVAASLATVILIVGARPGHHALLLLLVLMAACGAGARWAKHWVNRRTAPRQVPGADYRRLT